MKTVRYVVTPLISYQLTRFVDERVDGGTASDVETLGTYANAMDASREALSRAEHDNKAAAPLRPSGADTIATAHFEDEPLRDLARSTALAGVTIAYGATNLTGGCRID
jgi:Arc/MetJ-type ribon-helix-helix transcriptional regulator